MVWDWKILSLPSIWKHSVRKWTERCIDQRVLKSRGDSAVEVDHKASSRNVLHSIQINMYVYPKYLLLWRKSKGMHQTFVTDLIPSRIFLNWLESASFTAGFSPGSWILFYHGGEWPLRNSRERYDLIGRILGPLFYHFLRLERKHLACFFHGIRPGGAKSCRNYPTKMELISHYCIHQCTTHTSVATSEFLQPHLSVVWPSTRQPACWNHEDPLGFVSVEPKAYCIKHSILFHWLPTKRWKQTLELFFTASPLIPWTEAGQNCQRQSWIFCTENRDGSLQNCRVHSFRSQPPPKFDNTVNYIAWFSAWEHDRRGGGTIQIVVGQTHTVTFINKQ